MIDFQNQDNTFDVYFWIMIKVKELEKKYSFVKNINTKIVLHN